MPKPKTQVWEWEDGAIGVRGATSTEQARTLAREYVLLAYEYGDPFGERDEALEMLEYDRPYIYAVPGAYFTSTRADAWGDAVRTISDDSKPTPKGFARVYWWAH